MTQRIEAECQAAQRDEKRENSVFESAENRLAEATQEQRKDRAAILEDRNKVLRQTDAQLLALKHEEEAEISRMRRSSMRLSFSAVSSSTLSETLEEHSRLQTAADALAERARLQLSDAS